MRNAYTCGSSETLAERETLGASGASSACLSLFTGLTVTKVLLLGNVVRKFELLGNPQT